MSVYNYQSIKEHFGHKIVCVMYGDEINAAVECEDCHVVLISYDNREDDPREAPVVLKNLASEMKKRLLSQRIIEVEYRKEDDPSSASGGEEIEVIFSNQDTLLLYHDETGELRVEVD